MASTLLTQDNTGSVTVYLTLVSDDSAATGLTDTDVSVDLKKEGESSFSAKALSGSNFTEIGAGFYEIDLTAVETDTLGNLYIRVSGATTNTMMVVAFVAEEAVVNPTTAPSITKTPIFGYVVNPAGSPLQGASVSVRVLSTPYMLHGINDRSIVLSDDLVTAKTDSDGFFTIELVTGADVDLFIPAANFRRTFKVPSTSTNLFNIP